MHQSAKTSTTGFHMLNMRKMQLVQLHRKANEKQKMKTIENGTQCHKKKTGEGSEEEKKNEPFWKFVIVLTTEFIPNQTVLN